MNEEKYVYEHYAVRSNNHQSSSIIIIIIKKRFPIVHISKRYLCSQIEFLIAELQTHPSKSYC